MKNGQFNDIYNKEIAMCQKLSRENGGTCNWGTCATCGVIPLLHKLGTGEICEQQRDIVALKKRVLGINKTFL